MALITPLIYGLYITLNTQQAEEISLYRGFFIRVAHNLTHPYPIPIRLPSIYIWFVLEKLNLYIHIHISLYTYIQFVIHYLSIGYKHLTLNRLPLLCLLQFMDMISIQGLSLPCISLYLSIYWLYGLQQVGRLENSRDEWKKNAHSLPCPRHRPYPCPDHRPTHSSPSIYNAAQYIIISLYNLYLLYIKRKCSLLFHHIICIG